MEIDVVVLKGGHAVGSIRRPLRNLAGVPAVTYKGRLWPIQDGAIDIQPLPSSEPLSTQRLGRETDAVSGQLKVKKQVPLISPPAQEGIGLQIDKDQEHVITAPATARILVQAGPGSGKTEVTARRINHLLASGLSPSQILVLSFSRSAVRTLTRRLTAVSEASGEIENLRHVAIRTFDSWAFRLLRLAGHQPGSLLSRPHEINIEAVSSLISGPRREEVRELLGNRRHVFVDEFQDLTGYRALLAQQLLELFAPPSEMGCGFTLLGDSAQAIYGFAARDSEGLEGMDVWQEILCLYGDEVETVALRRNHRSSASIGALTTEIRSVLESDLMPDEKLNRVTEAVHGLPAVMEIGPEWAKRPFATSAILTRTNGDAIRVMKKLFGREVTASSRVVLKTGGHTPQPPAWVAALLAPLRSSTVPRSQFARIYDHLAGSLDSPVKEALALPHQDNAWLRLLRAANQAGEDSSLDVVELRARLTWTDAFPDDELLPEDGLYVTTVHQSKGMEFEEVHVLEPRAVDAASDASLEEASVGFVGITRARFEVGRIPADEIHSSLTRRSFARGPDRLCSWRGGWVNLEMGVPGDVSPESFVDEALHGSRAEVAEVQKMLLEDANELIGRKVLLCRVADENSKIFYDIHLQDEDGGPALKLGRTSSQLTHALLELLWKKGFSFPSKIMNLRISGLVTMTVDHETTAAIPVPWNSSRLWLGINLVGTGDFKSYKRPRGKK